MRKIVIGALLASCAFAAPALAREGEWYIEGGIGPMLLQDTKFDIGTIDDAAKLDTKKGYDFGGSIGYDFGGFRIETEASYRRANTKSITTNGVGIPTTSPTVLATGTLPAAGHATALSFSA